jgi:hypothetical protein
VLEELKTKLLREYNKNDNEYIKFGLDNRTYEMIKNVF